jgi:hypothetical protein
MKKLYSIIIEFKGGTYASQHYASNEIEALIISFKKNTADNELIDFEDKLLEEILSWIKESGPVLLNGLENIWYFSFSYKSKRGHCHIIKTVADKN